MGESWRVATGRPSPQECGHSFEILYDPEKPSRNTGSDMLDNRWVQWGAGIIGIALMMLPSPFRCGLGPWSFRVSRPPMRSLSSMTKLAPITILTEPIGSILRLAELADSGDCSA